MTTRLLSLAQEVPLTAKEPNNLVVNSPFMNYTGDHKLILQRWQDNELRSDRRSRVGRKNHLCGQGRRKTCEAMDQASG